MHCMHHTNLDHGAVPELRISRRTLRCRKLRMAAGNVAATEVAMIMLKSVSSRQSCLCCARAWTDAGD